MKKGTFQALIVFMCVLLAISSAACGTKPTDTSSLIDSTGNSSGSSSVSSDDTSYGDIIGSSDSGSAASSGSASASSSSGSISIPSLSYSTQTSVAEDDYDQADNLPDYKVTNKTLKLFVGLEKTLDDYLSRNPEVPGAFELCASKYGMKFELIKCDYNEWYTKLQTLKASNNMPDVMWPDPQTYPKDIALGLIQPLNQYFDFTDPIWSNTKPYMELYKWNNKYYHAIISSGQAVDPVFYNPKIFKANSLPTPNELMKSNQWTWSKMKELAIALTQDTNDDGQTDQWGIGGLMWVAIACSTGKPVVTVNGTDVTVNLNDPVFAKCADYIYSLGPKGLNLVNSFGHENSSLFVQGKVAMDVGAMWRAWTTYKDMWYKGEIELAYFPRPDDVSKYYADGYPFCLVMLDGAKNVEGAKAFIYASKYVTSTKYADENKDKVDNPYAYLYSFIPGLTDAQATQIQSVYDKSIPYNMNNWIGWFGSWDNGLQYAQEKKWSTILAVQLPSINDSINQYLDKLSKIK